METAIVIAILVLIVGGGIFYLLGQKKKGRHCVGCPYSGKCSQHCRKK